MAPAKKKRDLPPGLSALLIGFALLAAVNFLPPDTSLQLVREAGVLRVCVPASYPPLVTGDPGKPGFDVELLQELGKRLELPVSFNVVTAMGRDFNPRNWRITRASCQLVAGGVTTSALTRSLLETIPTGIENGWVLLLPTGASLAAGMKVGVYPGFSGLDRTRLSAYLRSEGVSVRLLGSAEALVAQLASGEIDAGVAGILDAERVAAAGSGLALQSLPGDLGVFEFGLGLWKGDLTLKREVLALYGQLEREGVVARLRERYGLSPGGPA